jgi:hypothetical protein
MLYQRLTHIHIISAPILDDAKITTFLNLIGRVNPNGLDREIKAQ